MLKQEDDNIFSIIEKSFEKFRHSKKWESLPNLQKGLMLRTLEKSGNCIKTANEFKRFLDKIMNEKKIFRLRSGQ